MLGTLGYNSYFSTKQAGLGKYMSSVLANIIYNMDKFSTTDTDTRIVVNIGSDGAASHGDMYGSNFIELGAGQSVTYTDGTYKYIFRVSTKEFEAVATNVIDFNHGYYFTATSQLSTQDHDALNANPNLIYNVWFNSYVLPSGFAKADMVNFYPAGEGELSGEFVQDISVVLGTEEIVNGGFDTDTDWTKGTDWSISGGFAVCSTFTVNSSLTPVVAPTVEGTLYVITFDVNSTSNTPYLRGFGAAQFKTVDGKNVYILVASAEAFAFFNSSTLPFEGTVDNVSVREATAQEIINYTASSRTSLLNQNIGATNHLVKQDATGRAIALADDYLIEHNLDNRYINIRFIPPSDKAWEIDFVMECLNDSIYKLSGAAPTDSASNCFIGQSNTAGLYGFLGATPLGASATPVSNGMHHIRLEFDGVGNGNFVIDNVTTYPYSLSNYTYSVNEEFFIGVRSRLGSVHSFPHNKPIGYFQYTEKTRTAAERDTDHAKAKTQHPTLP